MDNISNKIVIPLNNGYQLIAEQNTDPFDKEIFIGITDGNGAWWQDLAVIRSAYTYDDNGEIKWNDEEFDVLVYSDENNEDFTHNYIIGLFKGGI